MDLDPSSYSDLTSFFAKRFPAPEHRASLAAEARITFREPSTDDPAVAWGRLITRAREQSALARLADCAADRKPDDENLQGVAALIANRPWPPRSRGRVRPMMRQAAAFVALVTIAGATWMATTSDSSARVEGDPVGETQAESPVATAPRASEPPAPPTVPTEATVVGTAAPPPAPLAPANDATAPSEPPRADTEAEVPPTVTDEPVGTGTEEADDLGSCTGASQQLIGYWYAGATSPGKAGETIIVPSSVRVRADYPDVHNRFNARASVRCTLSAGAKVTLAADPIRVPGDAYWVPLHAPGT